MSKKQNGKSKQGSNASARFGKGANTRTIIGASLLALGAGVLFAVTRSGWSLSKVREAASGLSEGSGSQGTDPDLNAEVASATQSSPQNEGNFTDEGATGNND